MVPVDTPLPAAEAERLQEAFRLFNQVSAELSGAYAGLQAQVAQLTEELAAANGELRRQYQEKAALTERLSLLLDALPAGVVVIDRDGRVEKANPAARHILERELDGQGWAETAADLIAVSGTSDEWLTAKASRQRRVSLQETELDSAGGRILLLHDITEAQRLKAQAERNERLAAMGEMAASLAHQLRTPLAAALLYAGNLRRPELGASERAKCAERAVERLKAVERLIQDMLVFARGEAYGTERFEAGALAAEAAGSIEPLARERRVQFRVSAPPGPAELCGNRKALAGALTNLLENALEACAPGGRVELQVSARDDEVTFAVRDDGRGIDPAVQARLFEPFFTTRAEGTGLGLAIARGVARAHGGQIELASTGDGGTEFVLALPAGRRAESTMEQTA